MCVLWCVASCSFLFIYFFFRVHEREGSWFKAVGSLGNHDSETWRVPHITGTIVQELRKAGVTMLINEVEEKSDWLRIVGLGDWWYGYRTQFVQSLATPKPDQHQSPVVLVLSHNPDSVEQITKWDNMYGVHADMIFSGHTHGGTKCFPPVARWLIPYLSHVNAIVSRFPALKAIEKWEWDSGYHIIPHDNSFTHQYTSSGLDRFPPRYLCSVEVPLFTLRDTFGLMWWQAKNNNKIIQTNYF